MNEMALSPEALKVKAEEAADFMRLFSTPSRLMLLCRIAQKECSVGEIQEELEFKQPALSQQLAELRQAGVVKTRRESRQIYYSITDGRVAVVMHMLMQMFCGVAPATNAEGDADDPMALPSERAVGASVLGEVARWARLEDAD